MSGGSARADPGGQLYGDRQPAAAAAFVPFGDHDVGSSIFFQNSAVDAGGGTTPYSSITDYLEGFLEPAGFARHLDAPPVYAPEREPPVGDMIGHDDHKGAGGSATPITPNSSTSSEPRRGNKARPAPNEEGEVDEEAVSADRQNHSSDTKKKKKKKKEKVEKKARGSRVAFATKSEVDHLDDGYRWRKYGQKAVKNSSFPRSYYRCTTARCGVKKQVERSQHDPSTVVTTYEGQHAHPSPAAHRGMANTGANGLYSLASLQQQRHGFCPSSPNDLLLAAARAMAPAADATASPAALLPRQAEHRLGEYYGLQLQDPLLDDPHR